MRAFILLGLLALIFSNAYAREKKGEIRFRKFRQFPMKDKRGTDYPSSHVSIGGRAFTGISESPVHEISDQFSPGHSTSFLPLTSSNNHEQNGLTSMDLNTAKQHSGLSFLTLPVSSSIFSSGGKTGPVTFAMQSPSLANGKSAYINPSIYTGFGMQGLSAYTSGGSHAGSGLPYINMASHGMSYNLPVASSNIPTHGYTLPESSRGLSGGLIFSDNSHGSPLAYQAPSPTYHIGLSSGSSDSSSYYLPISPSVYPATQSNTSPHSRYGPHPVSSAGSSYAAPNTPIYSLPSTNYGVPSNSYRSPYSPASSSNPTRYYSSSMYSSPQSGYKSVASSHSNPSVSYASSSNSYSPASEYPSASQTSTSYESPEQQTSYSSITPTYVNEISGKSYNSDEVQFPKYDTISYSSLNGKY